MRIVYDSGKDHWAIKRHAKCAHCDTVVEFEKMTDFQLLHDPVKVQYTCPKCNRTQTKYKNETPIVTWQSTTD